MELNVNVLLVRHPQQLMQASNNKTVIRGILPTFITDYTDSWVSPPVGQGASVCGAFNRAVYLVCIDWLGRIYLAGL